MFFLNKNLIHRFLSFCLISCVFVIAGCQNGDQSNSSASGSINGPTQLIIPETGTQTVFITNNQSNAAVNISAHGLPAGLTSTSCTAQPSSTCSFNLISNNATPGVTNIQISGESTNTLAVNLTVSASPITKANISSSTDKISLKSPDTTSITLTNNSPVMAQNISVKNLPFGVTTTGCTNIPGPGMCELKFTSNHALLGATPITVAGENTNSLPATLLISPVEISTNSPITLSVGGTTTVPITDEDTAIPAENITATDLPSGVTVDNSCTAQPKGSCQLTLNASNNTTPGNTQITIAGPNTTSLQPNLIVSVIPPETTTISAPPSITLDSTGENKFEVVNTGAATAIGVSVLASSLPNDVTATPSAGCASLPPQNISLLKKAGIWIKSGRIYPSNSISCEIAFSANGAAPGTTTIKIAGSNTNTAEPSLTISPLNISTSSSISIATGHLTVVTVTNNDPTLAAENITATNLPSGVTVENSCTAQPKGSCQLALNANNNASPGTTQIDIAGSNTILLKPDLTVSVSPPDTTTISAPSITLNSTGQDTIEVTNTGAATATGINVVSSSLPSGVTAAPSAGCASLVPQDTSAFKKSGIWIKSGKIYPSESITCEIAFNSSAAAPGTTTIKIAGTNTNTAEPSLTISPLSISAPTNINLSAGNTTSVIVHNNDPVLAAENITIKNLPAGVSVGNSCTAQPLNNCTLNLAATSTVLSGTSNVTVVGSNTESVPSQLVVTAAVPDAKISVPMNVPMLTTGTAIIEVKNLSSVATQNINVVGLPANVTVTGNCSVIEAYDTCRLTLTSINATVTTSPIIVDISAANTNIASASLTISKNDIPTKPGYLPIGIIDKSQIADPSKVFISVKGFDTTVAAKSCYVTFNSDGIGQCTPIDSNLNYIDLGTPLTQFHVVNGKYYMYLPPMISGRIYISMGQGMEFNIAPEVNPITKVTSMTLQDPDSFKPRDPDYNILYDKMEFTYTNGAAYINPTAVDFFAIPLQLTMLGNSTYSGLTDKRSDILAKASASFTAPNVSSQWSKLFLNYNFHNVNTTLRVVSPSKAILIGTPNFSENPFDEAYLTDFNVSENKRENVFVNQQDESYVDNVWNYYRTHNLQVTDPDQINGKPMPIFTGHVDNNNNFIFTDNNDSSITFSMPKPVLSGTFFGGTGLDAGAPANNTYGAIITRNFTSAFDAGLLPGDQLILSKSTFRKMNAQQKFYFSNLNWYGPKEAPWYDLYSQVFHSFHDQNIYTFAYDDELGQDGTLVETEAQDTSMMPVLINIGDMSGTALPPLADSDDTIYNVTVVMQPGTVIKDLDNNTMLKDKESFSTKSPLSIEVFGTVEKIYFAPALILPELDSIGITPMGNTNMVLTFPAQNILGLAPGWNLANGCGVSLKNPDPNEGASAPLALNLTPSPCVISLSSNTVNAELTLNYNNGLKIINPISCQKSGNIPCSTAISADPNNNVGIPPPDAM